MVDDAPPVMLNKKDFYETVRVIFDSPYEVSCSIFMTIIGLPDFASLGVMQSILFFRVGVLTSYQQTETATLASIPDSFLTL